MNFTLSIEEALKLAISHHQANRLSEAESLYRTILQQQPKHPDANHNLGLLAIAVGKTDLALPFLKTALEANPNIAQFWLSYIGALLRLNNIENAKQTLEQAKIFGLAQDIVDSIQQQIDALSITNLFDTAISFREKGEYSQSVNLLQEWLELNKNASFELVATAHAHLAHAFFLLKNDNIALYHINKALSLAPNLPVVLKNYTRSLLRTRKIDEAMLAAEQVVKLEPEAPESLLIFAVALRAKNENQKALNIVEYVLQKKPNYAEALLNRSILKLAFNDRNAAIIDAEKAVSIKPHLNEAFALLASLYYQNKELPKAIDALEKALINDPDNVNYIVDLGEFKRQAYQTKEAIALLRKAVLLAPDNTAAWANLGVALHSDGHLEEAKEMYEKALLLNPQLAEVANNLAALVMKTESYEAALQFLEQALEYQPNNPTLLANKGGILLKLKRAPNEVGDIANKVIALAPNDSDGYRLLGSLYKELGELTKALDCFKIAITKNPSSAEMHTIVGDIYKNLGDIEAAKESYFCALALKPDSIEAISGLLFTSNYTAETNTQEDYNLAVRYGEVCSNKATQVYSTWLVDKTPPRLKIGFVSGDFRKHPVSYFLESFLKELNSEKLELIAYPTHHQTDTTTEAMRKLFAKWSPIYGLSDEAAAKHIHQDAVHILIDLSGHTNHNRLPVFAYKPAPIQVSWLGYFATTGVKEIDYILADKYVAPIIDDAYFVEKIWRLPDGYLCFTQPKEAPPINDLPAIQNQYVTFGCFNNLSKINDKVIDLWAQILQKLPNAKLMLKNKALADSAIALSIQEKFTFFGANADQLILEGPCSRAELLSAYNKIDIALDPFPYPGGTTSIESLWMGVPVITKAGNTFLSRVGESIAHNTYQTEWIAKDNEEYIQKALYFASDFRHLAKIRLKMRDQLLNSPAMLANQFAKNFETAMYDMWHKLEKSDV